MDSQIFDRLKLELGLKNFNKLIKEKLAPIPLDLVSFYFESCSFYLRKKRRVGLITDELFYFFLLR